MKTTALIVVALVAIGSAALFNSCSSIKDIVDQTTGLKKVKFRLSGITGMEVAGVKISDKTDLKSLSSGTMFMIGLAYTQKKLPTTFSVKLEALNPNAERSGATLLDCVLSRVDWRLIIDGKETVTGAVTTPIKLPSAGRSVTIPIEVNLDLYKFFSEKQTEDLAKLALAIGGAKNSPSTVKLAIRPKISTPLGEIAYPNEIIAIDKEYK